jgi:hypothetical protein
MDENKSIGAILTIIVIILCVGVIAGIMFGIPPYNVWAREMNGKAELAEAEWSKKVQIEEALANLEAEKLNAQAEVERAKGMAEAIKIEGGQLTAEYIQYMWVRQNTFNDKTTIYIPTETNLPILEARETK